MAIYGALAFEMGLSVAAGTLGGYFLDRLFDTEPILTIVFLFLGVVAGIINFVKLWELLKKKI
ncbi:MAG: AtpZ/AtpI family protein [bacterium]